MLPATITIPTWVMIFAVPLVLLGPVLAWAAAAHARNGERLRCHLLAREARRTVLPGRPEELLDLLVERIGSGRPDLSQALDVELTRLPGQAPGRAARAP